jgi:hypothetical protein
MAEQDESTFETRKKECKLECMRGNELPLSSVSFPNARICERVYSNNTHMIQVTSLTTQPPPYSTAPPPAYSSLKRFQNTDIHIGQLGIWYINADLVRYY